MFVKETISIERCCVRGHSRNIYSKIVPSHFMIIINFTITISWIKYSYNPFRLKDKQIADLIEGSVLSTLSVSFLLPSCEETPPESLPAFDTISSSKSNMPASEPFISKGIVEHTSNCEFLSRYTTWLLFGSHFHRQNVPIPQGSPLFTHQPYQIKDRVVLMRTSRKTHFRLWANL